MSKELKNLVPYTASSALMYLLKKNGRMERKAIHELWTKLGRTDAVDKIIYTLVRSDIVKREDIGTTSYYNLIDNKDVELKPAGKNIGKKLKRRKKGFSGESTAVVEVAPVESSNDNAVTMLRKSALMLQFAQMVEQYGVDHMGMALSGIARMGK